MITIPDGVQRGRAPAGRAMWRAARDYAQQYGLRVPTLKEVEEAEDYAVGSADYGAKWPYGLAEKMREVPNP